MSCLYSGIKEVKCPVCGRVKDEPKGFSGNNIDHTASYHLLLVKIHEIKEYYEKRAREDSVGDYRHDYSGKAEILKSLLE